MKSRLYLPKNLLNLVHNLDLQDSEVINRISEISSEEVIVQKSLLSSLLTTNLQEKLNLSNEKFLSSSVPYYAFYLAGSLIPYEKFSQLENTLISKIEGVVLHTAINSLSKDISETETKKEQIVLNLSTSIKENYYKTIPTEDVLEAYNKIKNETISENRDYIKELEEKFINPLTMEKISSDDGEFDDLDASKLISKRRYLHIPDSIFSLALLKLVIILQYFATTDEDPVKKLEIEDSSFFFKVLVFNLKKFLRKLDIKAPTSEDTPLSSVSYISNLKKFLLYDFREDIPKIESLYSGIKDNQQFYELEYKYNSTIRSLVGKNIYEDSTSGPRLFRYHMYLLHNLALSSLDYLESILKKSSNIFDVESYISKKLEYPFTKETDSKRIPSNPLLIFEKSSNPLEVKLEVINELKKKIKEQLSKNKTAIKKFLEKEDQSKSETRKSTKGQTIVVNVFKEEIIFALQYSVPLIELALNFSLLFKPFTKSVRSKKRLEELKDILIKNISVHFETTNISSKEIEDIVEGFIVAAFNNNEFDEEKLEDLISLNLKRIDSLINDPNFSEFFLNIKDSISEFRNLDISFSDNLFERVDLLVKKLYNIIDTYIKAFKIAFISPIFLNLLKFIQKENNILQVNFKAIEELLNKAAENSLRDKQNHTYLINEITEVLKDYFSDPEVRNKLLEFFKNSFFVYERKSSIRPSDLKISERELFEQLNNPKFLDLLKNNLNQKDFKVLDEEVKNIYIKILSLASNKLSSSDSESLEQILNHIFEDSIKKFIIDLLNLFPTEENIKKFIENPTEKPKEDPVIKFLKKLRFYLDLASNKVESLSSDDMTRLILAVARNYLNYLATNSILERKYPIAFEIINLIRKNKDLYNEAVYFAVTGNLTPTTSKMFVCTTKALRDTFLFINKHLNNYITLKARKLKNSKNEEDQKLFEIYKSVSSNVYYLKSFRIFQYLEIYLLEFLEVIENFSSFEDTLVKSYNSFESTVRTENFSNVKVKIGASKSAAKIEEVDQMSSDEVETEEERNLKEFIERRALEEFGNLISKFEYLVISNSSFYKDHLGITNLGELLDINIKGYDKFIKDKANFFIEKINSKAELFNEILAIAIKKFLLGEDFFKPKDKDEEAKKLVVNIQLNFSKILKEDKYLAYSISTKLSTDSKFFYFFKSENIKDAASQELRYFSNSNIIDKDGNLNISLLDKILDSNFSMISKYLRKKISSAKDTEEAKNLERILDKYTINYDTAKFYLEILKKILNKRIVFYLSPNLDSRTFASDIVIPERNYIFSLFRDSVIQQFLSQFDPIHVTRRKEVIYKPNLTYLILQNMFNGYFERKLNSQFSKQSMKSLLSLLNSSLEGNRIDYKNLNRDLRNSLIDDNFITLLLKKFLANIYYSIFKNAEYIKVASFEGKDLDEVLNKYKDFYKASIIEKLKNENNPFVVEFYSTGKIVNLVKKEFYIIFLHYLIFLLRRSIENGEVNPRVLDFILHYLGIPENDKDFRNTLQNLATSNEYTESLENLDKKFLYYESVYRTFNKTFHSVQINSFFSLFVKNKDLYRMLSVIGVEDITKTISHKDKEFEAEVVSDETAQEIAGTEETYEPEKVEVPSIIGREFYAILMQIGAGANKDLSSDTISLIEQIVENATSSKSVKILSSIIPTILQRWKVIGLTTIDIPNALILLALELGLLDPSNNNILKNNPIYLYYLANSIASIFSSEKNISIEDNFIVKRLFNVFLPNKKANSEFVTFALNISTYFTHTVPGNGMFGIAIKQKTHFITKLFSNDISFIDQKSIGKFEFSNISMKDMTENEFYTIKGLLNSKELGEDFRSFALRNGFSFNLARLRDLLTIQEDNDLYKFSKLVIRAIVENKHIVFEKNTKNGMYIPKLVDKFNTNDILITDIRR